MVSTPWLPAVLQALVDDESVTDVLVNGADGVWADRGAGPVRVPADLGGEDAVRALAVRLAAGVGRRLDESRPWVDARLADGVRLHAVVPPVSPGGTHLSLRVLRPGRFGLDELVRAGAVPPVWRRLLEALVAARGRPPRDRRHRHRQDHPARAPSSRSSRRPSGSCSSRTSASSAPGTRTSCGSRPGTRTSRAAAR